MSESAKCYNGDTVLEIIMTDYYYLIKCTNSVYRVDPDTNKVTRIL